MKVLKCSDIGVPGSFQVIGYNDEEVINKMYKHIRKAHPDLYETETPTMREKMKKILKKQKA